MGVPRARPLLGWFSTAKFHFGVFIVPNSHLFPKQRIFRFAESVLKPHALPRNFLGRTPKEKHPFLFQKKLHPRQIRNARSVFSFGVAGVLASAWGFLRAYRTVLSHHARGACDIICFGNRCEFGTINTPVFYLTEF